jgi:hypothetical protein
VEVYLHLPIRLHVVVLASSVRDSFTVFLTSVLWFRYPYIDNIVVQSCSLLHFSRLDRGSIVWKFGNLCW